MFVLVKHAFIVTCGFVLGALVVEYKHYFAQKIPVPIAVLSDGGLYDGDLRKGMLHGKGRLAWPDESYYEGEFSEGLFHGQGLLHTPTYFYRGEFQTGNMTGEGEINFVDGNKYQGDVTFGLANGSGVLEKANGDIYKGEFKDNLYHGEGELVSSNGDIYVGSFKKGLFDGQGVYTVADANKQPHQDAQYKPSSMKMYSGTFVEGQLSGQGVWVDGEQRYEGQFLNWKFHGEGVYSDPSGTYSGQFVNGAYHGKGEYISSFGDKYLGDFANGNFHGKGELVSDIGDRYNGGFEYGRKHGKGVLQYSEALDGIEEVKGEWAYGRLIKANHPELVVRKNDLVEYALYNQLNMVKQNVSQLEPQDPEAIDLYFVGVAGDGSQGVFRREVNFVKNYFDNNYYTQGYSVNLINSSLDYDKTPLATVTSIKETLTAVAEKMDSEQDILFVYFTSHGSKDFKLHLSQPGLDLAPLSADALAEILKALPVRNKVVVISACYSGGFVKTVKTDTTLVITAASADKASFGCSDRSQMTYFGEAFFKDSLPQSDSFVDAFYRARDIVRGREAKEGFENSNPLIFKPKGIVEQLGKWREQLKVRSTEGPLAARAPVE